MVFKIQELSMAKKDIKEFKICYDTLSPVYDLRVKAGLLCIINNI